MRLRKLNDSLEITTIKGYQAYFAALFAVFIWGAFPALIKGALQFNSIEQLLTLRFLVSTLIFASVIPSTFKKIRQLSLNQCLAFIIIVIVLFYSQTYALEKVPASWYIAVFTFVPIIFMFVYREPLNILGIIGSAFAVIGMGIFFISIRHEAGMSLWHAILLIISMLAWVAYSVITKQLHHHLRDRELVLLTNLVGLLFSSIAWGLHGFKLQNLSLTGVSLCILTGILLPLALVTYSFSLRFKPIFAVFSQYLEPVIGLLIAAVFLGEEMNVMQYTAAAIVIIGTLLVGIATRKA